MKDIVIKERYIRRELWILLLCFAAMEIVNIYAVISYGAPWTEAFTSLGFVVVAAVAAYMVLGVIRFLISVTIRLINKKQ